MTRTRSLPAPAQAVLLASALFLLTALAQAAGGGAATVGQSTGPGASAPGMAASDPPKARPAKSGVAHDKRASAAQRGQERASAPRRPASAP